MNTHTWVVAVLALLSMSGCGQRSTSAKTDAKDVNTQHLKGTTEVLKNYRYGERSTSAAADKSKATEAKTR